MSAIGQLSAGVAHEIKNPLAIITLSIESFEMIQPDMKPELKERLKMVKDAVNRANKVVGDLLSFSRQAEMKIMPFDFIDVIQKALDFAKKKSIMKNIQYITRFLQDGPVIMEGDPVLITQVVLNILSNAIDAIADDGGITLETDVVTDGKTGRQILEMKVIDTGCGMPPQVLKRIFEPFYTTKDQGEGTGLGLSLVYKIVERHEGSIEAESEEGEGTTVTVRLPLKTRPTEKGEDHGG
jgi:two-component system sporulation sensor kinase A